MYCCIKLFAADSSGGVTCSSCESAAEGFCPLGAKAVRICWRSCLFSATVVDRSMAMHSLARFVWGRMSEFVLAWVIPAKMTRREVVWGVEDEGERRRAMRLERTRGVWRLMAIVWEGWLVVVLWAGDVMGRRRVERRVERSMIE